MNPAEPGPELGETPAAVPPERDPVLPWRVTRLLLETVLRSMSAVDEALTRPPARRVAVDVLIGAGAFAGDFAGDLACQVADRVAMLGRRIGDRVPQRLDPSPTPVTSPDIWPASRI